jgi:hypothetical protein
MPLLLSLTQSGHSLDRLSGGIDSRRGLKIPWGKPRAGSSPAAHRRGGFIETVRAHWNSSPPSSFRCAPLGFVVAPKKPQLIKISCACAAAKPIKPVCGVPYYHVVCVLGRDPWQSQETVKLTGLTIGYRYIAAPSDTALTPVVPSTLSEHVDLCIAEKLVVIRVDFLSIHVAIKRGQKFVAFNAFEKVKRLVLLPSLPAQQIGFVERHNSQAHLIPLAS